MFQMMLEQVLMGLRGGVNCVSLRGGCDSCRYTQQRKCQVHITWWVENDRWKNWSIYTLGCDM